jgi:hypothetical protein
VTVGSINYVGDPAHLFDKSYEKRIAEILLSGRNVTNTFNYDDRQLQEILIRKLDVSPEIVVMGSSRTMLIGEQTLNKSEVRNSSVAGASLEDLIAIYQLYKSENNLPKKFLIGLDPWIFNANNGQERWKTLSEEYCAFKNNDCFQEGHISKIKQLLSPSYFQSSMKNILGKKIQPKGTRDRHNEYNTILSDGSLTYNREMREKNHDQVLKSIVTYTNAHPYSLSGFNNLFPRYVEEFKLLINDMEEAGVEVEFILIPYPPQVYSVLKSEYSTVIEVENFIRRFAENRRIEIHGSYNPIPYELRDINFYDGMHLKPESITQILQ